MKLRIQFKDPDAVEWSLDEDALSKGLDTLSPRERREVVNLRREDAREACGKWFQDGEYVTIEVDTDADTATVIRP